jgi:Predicted redox protein, regulator of disulfide bond formation
MFRVETRSVGAAVTALGSAGPFTLTIDRPIEGGGGGLGFSGGQLLHLAVAGCISNDLFREASRLGITLSRVQVVVDGEFDGDPAVSSGIRYQVSVDGDRPRAELDHLVALVDRIAEIPNSLRRGTAVTLVERVDEDANATSG